MNIFITQCSRDVLILDNVTKGEGFVEQIYRIDLPIENTTIEPSFCHIMF